ncbi:MarR family winged helix-turn-helix transcriptional regulator [Phaeovulum vinaykumarii]|uniref:Transcriptional regulator, MarR family n=1 Tax=Phaeovulum vinaykumarii TaxID=407234 RepID=A0A1N7L465_9RHOB|nr:MarR family transcriptional regulator [Phaeovulum vinaykumarii]SIS68628.1 transcriptional regulator, MarR family [Phaeovulum vinaykumarii]SOB99956.1 MarR family transcriptional regulator [Phaeovulum vinaykumarii]
MTVQSSLAPPAADMSLGVLLHDATRLMRRRFEARTAHLGLSSSQWRLLVLLIEGGRMSQARLAEALEVEPISVSRIVNRMAAGGWVKREPDPRDARARLVSATPKALEAQEKAREIAYALYEESLEGLPAEYVSVLYRALGQVVANLSNGPVLDGSSDR